jgi:hypothetical protein
MDLPVLTCIILHKYLYILGYFLGIFPSALYRPRPEGPKAAPHLLRLRVDAAVLEETNDANDPSKARAIMRIYMDFNRR